MRNRFMLSIVALFAVALASGCEPGAADDDGGGPRADSGATQPGDDAGRSPEEDSGTGSTADAGDVVEPPTDAGGHAEPDAGRDGGPTEPADRGLRVVGNRILKDGVPIQIRGVNRSGTEFACVQRGEIFD